MPHFNMFVIKKTSKVVKQHKKTGTEESQNSPEQMTAEKENKI